MTDVTHETTGKVNLAGHPAGATLDQSLRSDFVTRGRWQAGRFPGLVRTTILYSA